MLKKALLPVMEESMAIESISIFSDVYRVFYNLINNNIPDPSSRNKQWVFSEFPEQDLAENKLKYPIIIIEPADASSWTRLTMTKTVMPLTISISAYSSRMVQADTLLCNIVSVIDSNRLLLKGDEGLNFLMLEDTDTDFELRGGTRAHIRTASYSFEYTFKDGLSKGINTKIIASDGEIA